MHTNTSTVVIASSVWRERRKKAGYDLVHQVRYRERSLLRVCTTRMHIATQARLGEGPLPVHRIRNTTLVVLASK